MFKQVLRRGGCSKALLSVKNIFSCLVLRHKRGTGFKITPRIVAWGACKDVEPDGLVILEFMERKNDAIDMPEQWPDIDSLIYHVDE